MMKEQSKKILVASMITIIVIILSVIGATYAYFAGGAANNAVTTLSTVSNTIDNLNFSTGSSISITANQDNFAQGQSNRSGSTTATVTLTAKNDSASTYYYRAYILISDNNYEYTNGTTPELVLNVSKNGTNIITNRDVTTTTGVIDVPITSGGSSLKHAITANAGATTTDTWTVTVTFVNLETNQSANANKMFKAVIYFDEAPTLPAAYQEVTYIQNAGSRYYNTGIIPDNTTGMFLDYDLTVATGDTILVGTRGSVTDSRYWIANSSSLYLGFNKNDFRGVASVANTRHTAALNYLNDRKKKRDNQVFASISVTLAEQSYPIFVYAFNKTGTASNISKYKLFSLKISRGNELIAKYVPCYRISDTTIGLYDTISGVFLEPLGSGTLNKGANVS